MRTYRWSACRSVGNLREVRYVGLVLRLPTSTKHRMLDSRRYLPVYSPKIEWRESRTWLRQLSKVVARLGLIGPCLDLLVADAAPAKKMLIGVSAVYGNLP